MFISDAYAVTTAVPAMEGNSVAATLIQLALILVIFYFLLIRPQQKRIKDHTTMVESLKLGDRVLTNGGMYGKITKIMGMEITIEIAQGVNVVIDRMSIASLANPVVENKKKA